MSWSNWKTPMAIIFRTASQNQERAVIHLRCQCRNLQVAATDWLAQLVSAQGNGSTLLDEQIVEGVSVGTAEPAAVPNSIEFSEAPTDLIAGEAAIEFTVNYSISNTSAYMSYSNWKTLMAIILQDFVTKSETGSHTFTIPVPQSSR